LGTVVVDDGGSVGAASPELGALLLLLATVAPDTRITLREPILAHGANALDALVETVDDRPDLGPQVISWLEVLAGRDAKLKTSAIATIRSIATHSSDLSIRYATPALVRLGAAARPSSSVERKAASIPRAAGLEWPGFQEHEFGRNEGTQWRSVDEPTSLAPILTRELQQLDRDFISYGVTRSPEIHFAVARRYKSGPESGVTASKLVVYAHGPNDDSRAPRQVVAGYYIERGDDKAESIATYGSPDNVLRWDWPLFIAALEDPRFCDGISGVMRKHQLRVGDYLDAGRGWRSLGWTASLEEGEIVARDADEVVFRGWPAMQERLIAVPATQWIDLHIWRAWPAEEAIGAGQPFALEALAPVLLDLAPLYLEIVGRR